MDKISKKQLFEAQTLIERMDKHFTKGQLDVLMENINEVGNSGKATAISLPNLESFFTQTKIKNGTWAAVGYIQMYSSKGLYPLNQREDGKTLHDYMSGFSNDFTDDMPSKERFNRFMDKEQNTEWDTPTGRGTRSGKPMKDNIYKYILKLTTYQIQWQNPDKYSEKEGELNKRETELKNNLAPYNTDGKYFKTRTPEEEEEYQEKLKTMPRYYYGNDFLGQSGVAHFGVKGDDGEYVDTMTPYRHGEEDKEFSRTALRHVLGDTKKQKPIYLGVLEDGSVEIIPNSLGKMLHGTEFSNIDKKLEQITDEKEREFAKQFYEFQETRQMMEKTWLLKNIAYLCAGGYYWRNPNPLFLLQNSKKEYSQYDINEQDLTNLLSRFAGTESQEIARMENTNV